MERKKVQMSVYLSEVQLGALRAVSNAYRLPVALLIRDAVDDYLRAVDARVELKLGRPSRPRRRGAK